MHDHPSRASGVGLERLCSEASGDWLQSTNPSQGIEGLEAWFRGVAYSPHRHDTYAICLTTSGIQAFHYRGKTEYSHPGQVVVLHPDELHDGFAGSEAGFGYRILYIEPAQIFEAAQVVCSRPCALPFVRNPVMHHPQLAALISGAFHSMHEPLAINSLVVQVAEALLSADPGCATMNAGIQFDTVAVERARQFLAAEYMRVIHSTELETVTGLSRYELARQFRRIHGTSPYRYVLMRRVTAACQLIARQQSLAEIAAELGFADQAHLTRMFKAAYGLTPAQYRRLYLPKVAP